MKEHYASDCPVATEEEQNPAVYPELYNLSAAFMYRFMARPLRRERPEFLYLPIKPRRGIKPLELTALIGSWNMCWEQAQLRSELIAFKDEWEGVRASFPALKFLEGRNVYLLPDTEKRFNAYVPMYSMLPLSILVRFGLPPIRRMTWPAISTLDLHRVEPFLPTDFRERLSRAFAAYVWPLMKSGSSLDAFGKDEPIKLLAHNLEFWLPHAVSVAEDKLSALPLVDFETEKDRLDLAKIQAEVPQAEAMVDRCRMGGHIWLGEDEASEATGAMIESADKNGGLRSLIDAVRSNRVEEDFSGRWSYAREDFERKLYRKRNKIRVKFVELGEAEGVVGPESELADRLVWQDFFALLNAKEREIVVCLTKSATNLTEAAEMLGYANHTPVSKALTRIRRKADKLLNEE